MTAATVLPCADLNETAVFFESLGFRTDMVIPADSPIVLSMSGHGLAIRLDRSAIGSAGQIRLQVDDLARYPDHQLIAPNGTSVTIVAAGNPMVMPELSAELEISRLDDDGFGVGRAGMLYRDLIPGRQGGRFIASHIKIPVGGEVPDMVHYHRIRFQMLYCYKGWVKVLYEDQGDSITMHAGDAVLQAPEIRHRVVENSDGFEIIEIGCPAEHDTFFDHDLELPTASHLPDRDFGDQRFVHHIAIDSPWNADGLGFERRDIGIAAATNGLAGAQVLRTLTTDATSELAHDLEFCFHFIL
jgi:quercetin dioxygenase-like cupin family protein